MKKLLVLLAMLGSLWWTSPAKAINNVYGASCLTGAAGCVDGIDVGDADGKGTDLAVGDICFVIQDAGTNQPEVYIYRLYSTSAAESSPNIIKPDYENAGAYSGALRWYLVKLVANSVDTGFGTDGSRGIAFQSNTTFAPAGNEIYFLNDVFVVAENGVARYVATADSSGNHIVGTSLDATANYAKLDTLAADTAGPPAAEDCDAAAEVGRMIVSTRYTATAEYRLWVCTQTGAASFAWKYVVLN